MLEGWAAAHRFDIIDVASGQIAGRISLRLGDTEDIVLYAGHIGYEVSPRFRGNRYAARSLMLVLSKAKLVGMNEVWVTCNPDNTASKRTCEVVGGQYVETVEVPPTSRLYANGARAKCRYRFDLCQLS